MIHSEVCATSFLFIIHKSTVKIVVITNKLNNLAAHAIIKTIDINRYKTNDNEITT